MRPPKSIRPMLPPFASCEICGEHRLAALRTRPINGRVLCIRCTSKKRREPGPCSLCGSRDIHLEDHHPWGRKLQAALEPRLSDQTWHICENCHAWFSYFLLPLMDQQERGLRHPFGVIIEMIKVGLLMFLLLTTPHIALAYRKAIVKGSCDAD